MPLMVLAALRLAVLEVLLVLSVPAALVLFDELRFRRELKRMDLRDPEALDKFQRFVDGTGPTFLS